MLIIRLVIGAVIIICGAYATLTGETLLWNKGKEKYTRESLEMYNRLSGILHMLIGIGILLFNVGNSSGNIVLLSWMILSVIWVAIATNITLYLIALVKK